MSDKIRQIYAYYLEFFEAASEKFNLFQVQDLNSRARHPGRPEMCYYTNVFLSNLTRFVAFNMR